MFDTFRASTKYLEPDACVMVYVLFLEDMVLVYVMLNHSSIALHCVAAVC